MNEKKKEKTPRTKSWRSALAAFSQRGTGGTGEGVEKKGRERGLALFNPFCSINFPGELFTRAFTTTTLLPLPLPDAYGRQSYGSATGGEGGGGAEGAV